MAARPLQARENERVKTSADRGERLDWRRRATPGEIVGCLEIDPKLRRRVEGLGEQPSSLRCDASLGTNKLVDALDWDAEMGGERHLGDAEWGEKLLA
jgi:hypothetical protein